MVEFTQLFRHSHESRKFYIVNLTFKYFLNILIIIYFFLIIFAPFHYYEIKIPLLVSFIILSFIKLLHLKISSITQEIILLTLFYVFIGSFYLLYGMPNAEDNSFIYILLLYVIYPFIYLTLIIGIDKNIIILLLNTLVFAGFILSLYLIIVVLMFNNVIPFSETFLHLGYISNIAIKNGAVEIQTTSLSSLVFIFPFVIALLFLPDTKFVFFNKKSLALIALVIFIASILSLRRALILTNILSFITLLFFVIFLRKKILLKFIKTFLKYFLIIILATFISIYLFYKNQRNIFDINPRKILEEVITLDENSDTERIMQFYYFQKLINERPFLGYGFGVKNPYIIRDNEKKWRYELSYLALAFHTGFIGLVLYAIGVLWIYIKGFKIIKKNNNSSIIMIALLNGITAMLIAYSSNPYLNAFDILWVLFLPIAYINLSYKIN